MSSPRYSAAASRAHGPGTISDALVATPSRSASYTPTLAAWHEPRSSQEMITSRSSARGRGVRRAWSSARGRYRLLGTAPRRPTAGGLARVRCRGHEARRRGRCSGGMVSGRGVALADERQVDEQAVGGCGTRRRAGGRSRRAPRRRARAGPACPAGSSALVYALSLRAEALHRRVRLLRLGRVDADQPHPLVAARRRDARSCRRRRRAPTVGVRVAPAPRARPPSPATAALPSLPQPQSTSALASTSRRHRAPAASAPGGVYGAARSGCATAAR